MELALMKQPDGGRTYTFTLIAHDLTMCCPDKFDRMSYAVYGAIGTVSATLNGLAVIAESLERAEEREDA